MSGTRFSEWTGSKTLEERVEQVSTALSCCASDSNICDECPYQKVGMNCAAEMKWDAQKLIRDLYKPLGSAQKPAEQQQTPTRASILEDARKCVCGEREGQYGSPENNFQTIAELWGIYCEREFSAVDVAVMMALLKVARIKSDPTKVDSWVDGCGYLACGGELGGKQ